VDNSRENDAGQYVPGMPQDGPFQGVVGRTLEESTPWWPPVPRAPEGAPNVVVVLLDDVGYGQLGCYGSDISTPTFDRLARDGLRYSNFHTTALCSPTRACLLSGRNHHSNGMARIAEMAQGFPGYDATIPHANGFLSEILLGQQYATFAVGKWHLTPAHETTMGGRRHRWPLGRGFERFYGFLGAETDQYHPDLVYDSHQIDPPRPPEEGYHLTEDLADRAIEFVNDMRAVDADRPFLLWFAPGACHSPHQAPAEYIDRYRGRFDKGWDAWRDEAYARQLASGLLPPGTALSERPPWVDSWESRSPEERRLYARMMEVFAGFLEHTDAQVGRVVDHLDALGELDDTIVLVMSDNGASAEGGPRGSFNEMFFFNLEPESLEENLRRIDDLGTPRAHGHYPWAWAWAGNTPLRRWKRETHEGGVTDPLIVHWPARLGRPGEVRHQYVHAIDVLPTLLEVIGIEAPETIGGIEQTPIEGVSFAATLTDPAASSGHVTQYYEMLGARAIYHDGWKAVVFHPMPFLAYDGSDPNAPFDDDPWELFHVADDFSETRNLAAAEPAKLRAMVDLWWSEAEKYHVLPLNNRAGWGGDPRHRRRERYEYQAGVAGLPEQVAPNLRNRPWRIVADLDVPTGTAAGAIVSQGGNAGGYLLYVDGGRVHYAYNFLGMATTTVVADRPLAPGPVQVAATFTPTGHHRGEVELFHGDTRVGRGTVERMAPVTFGMTGFDVGRQRGTPVVEGLDGRFELPPGMLRRVVVEVSGRAETDGAAQQRAGLAAQ
jgi:arylsulfatase A-like enzyme